MTGKEHSVSNETYDKIKLAALIIVPTLTFLSSCCTILEFPGFEKAVAIIAAFNVLIGAWVKSLSDTYHKGESDE